MRQLFYDDYSEGAHPEILAALVAANAGQELGYGEDSYSRLAAERIALACGRPDAAVHLVSGGTQANLICLAALLRPHQGVIAAATGHIYVHEAGAIEATGHKIIAVPSPDGLLTPDFIDAALATHQDEHSVMPRVVFVSQASELGTVYSLEALRALVEHAHGRGLLVYLDGARLAPALDAAGTSLAELVDCGVDILYLGGTKNGAWCGEAVVIPNADLQTEFRYHLKQRGALLAKGRLLGIQFARFFAEDGLWYELGRQANARAARLASGLRELRVELLTEPAVNQVFAILPGSVIEPLQADFGFHVWQQTESGTVVRLVCSWATPEAAIDEFLSRVGALTG